MRDLYLWKFGVGCCDLVGRLIGLVLKGEEKTKIEVYCFLTPFKKANL